MWCHTTKEKLMTECIPARLRNGEIASHCRHAIRIARQALIEREGPPPTPRHVCRHLCANDSQCHKRVDGFVCVIHTTWGTHIENMNDIPIEIRRSCAAAAGKVGAAAGGKVGGKIVCNLEYTCPHCSREGHGPSMKRWHFDNCPRRPQ